MIWFVTMLGGVLGLYAKGHKWASRKQDNPVVSSVTELSSKVSDLTGSIAEYAGELHKVADRVTALESKNEVRIGGKSDV